VAPAAARRDELAAVGAWPGQAMKASPGCTWRLSVRSVPVHQRQPAARPRGFERVSMEALLDRHGLLVGDDLALHVQVRGHAHQAQRLRTTWLNTGPATAPP
jgi:hypothetical protein